MYAIYSFFCYHFCAGIQSLRGRGVEEDVDREQVSHGQNSRKVSGKKSVSRKSDSSSSSSVEKPVDSFSFLEGAYSLDLSKDNVPNPLVEKQHLE